MAPPSAGPDLEANGEDCSASAEERFVIRPCVSKHRLYSMAFVEFRNNGELWKPEQLQEALRAIDGADRRSDHRVLAITFIHGWKNNARQVNNNVHDFRLQLNNIAAKACMGAENRCGVVGIYLAWSGDLVSRYSNTLRTLTYFNRRDTAEQVSSERQKVAPVGDALFAIMKRVKSGAGRETNHSVVVGHSFGGLILEHAIYSQMQQIGRGLQNAAPSTRPQVLADFADLVVLINQAAPADRAISLLNQYRKEGLQNVRLRLDCSPDDTSPVCMNSHPLLLSVSSKTDLATKTILPIAETISPPPADDRLLLAKDDLPSGLDEAKVYHTAAAHTDQLQSHVLRDGPCLTNGNTDNIPVKITLPAYAPGNNMHSPKVIEYCLLPVPDKDAYNHTPYWIFQIPPEVVPDHGTIFTNRFTEFLTAFMPPLKSFNAATPAPPPIKKLYRDGF